MYLGHYPCAYPRLDMYTILVPVHRDVYDVHKSFSNSPRRNYNKYPYKKQEGIHTDALSFLQVEASGLYALLPSAGQNERVQLRTRWSVPTSFTVATESQKMSADDVLNILLRY